LHLKSIKRAIFSIAIVLSLASANRLDVRLDNNQNNNKTMSSNQFSRLVKATQPNQVAAQFGTPDEMVAVKTSTGSVEGMVWIYRDMVAKKHRLHDARFLIINGEMKYIFLS
jgi:hypothetical protein